MYARARVMGFYIILSDALTVTDGVVHAKADATSAEA
jgi:hypothetical protein